jgi:drug/metabolite transporter (DMT)-like permease
MNPRKLLLPPLVPLLFLFALCGFVFLAPSQMINGAVDKDPRRAAMIIAVLSPAFYALFAVLNLVDSAFDRWRGLLSWTFTAAMVVVVGVLIFRLLYSGGVDVTPVYPLAIGFGLACAILIPMKIVRGCSLRRHFIQTNTEQTGPDNRHTAGV